MANESAKRAENGRNESRKLAKHATAPIKARVLGTSTPKPRPKIVESPAVLERRKRGEAITSITASLANVPHVIYVCCDVAKLNEIMSHVAQIGEGDLDASEDGGRAVFEERLAKGTKALQLLYDVTPLVNWELAHKTGILWTLLAMIVRGRQQNQSAKYMVSHVRQAKDFIKRLYKLSNGIHAGQFQWNATALSRFVGWGKESSAVYHDLDAFLSTFTLALGVTPRAITPFERLQPDEIIAQMARLDHTLTAIKVSAETIPGTIVIRLNFQILNYVAAALEDAVENLLYFPILIKKEGKDHIIQILSALASHTDALPDLDRLVENAPKFLGTLRRAVHGRHLLEPRLGRDGVATHLETIYVNIHPEKDTMQLNVAGYKKRLAQDVFERQTPVSISVEFYRKDFCPKDKIKTAKKIPVKDAEIHRACDLVRQVFVAASYGIIGQEREAILIPLCKEVDAGLSVLEDNYKMTLDRVLKIGEQSLVRNLRHPWHLLTGAEENPELHKRIMKLSDRSDRLFTLWSLMFRKTTASNPNIKATLERQRQLAAQCLKRYNERKVFGGARS